MTLNDTNGEKPIRNPVVILREEFDDWAVLFNPDTGHGVGLNPTGVYLWKLLDGGHDLNALLKETRDHADNVPEEASDHIGAFVDALVAEELAGFGLANAVDRPEGVSFPPPRELKQFSYEPPQLIDFRGGRTAYGICGPGSGNAGSGCKAGNVAEGYCMAGTSATAGQCYTNGTSASGFCSPYGVGAGGVCTGGSTANGTCGSGGNLY